MLNFFVINILKTKKNPRSAKTERGRKIHVINQINNKLFIYPVQALAS